MQVPVRSFCALLIVTILLFSSIPCFAQRKSFDYTLLRCAEGCRTKKQNSFFKFISIYNNPVCLSGPAALLVSGLIQHKSILEKKALFNVESITAAETMVFSLKLGIGRIRPFKYDTTFTAVVNARNKAFPSGHTTEAFAMATAMSIAVPKWYVVVPAFAWASMIAYARVYLGVHYPTDVIGGAILGSGTTYLMYRLNKWLVRDSNESHHPRNEIFGTVAGIGGAYLLYKINDWITKRKHRLALKPTH